jgi:hypothetical protein
VTEASAWRRYWTVLVYGLSSPGKILGWIADIPVIGLLLVVPAAVLVAIGWMLAMFVMCVAAVMPPFMALGLVMEGAQLLADEHGWGLVIGTAVAFAAWVAVLVHMGRQP